jgi:hypothetical protein
MESGEQRIKQNRHTAKNTADDGNVLQSTRLRRTFLFSPEIDEFLLDYNLSFLPGISLMLWVILLTGTIL